MKRIPLPTAPDKPKHGEPCNGCGYCCAAEVCAIGQAVFGEEQPAPCPAMKFEDGRFLCGLVAWADGMDDDFGGITNTGRAIRLLLGVGMGCDADDFQEQGQP